MERRWSWLALAIAGAWSLYLSPGILFLIMFPEPRGTAALVLGGIAWLAIGAAAWSEMGGWRGPVVVLGHVMLLVAIFVLFDLTWHWMLLPQAAALTASVASATHVPWPEAPA